MKKLAILLSFCALLGSCQPKPITPITDLLGRVWKASMVNEADVLVFTLGAASNIKPGYVSFRLDLSQPNRATLIDLDGRKVVGTWSVSTDNKRLILDNLNPKPTNTGGTIEYYILNDPTASSLNLERTAESRKTGNTIDRYDLVPE